MGTDIYGFVECRPTFGESWNTSAEWVAAVGLEALYWLRDYAAFGCLFGVRGRADFEPLAARRGLPADVAERTRAACGAKKPGESDETWIGWAEVAAVDWNERSAEPGPDPHKYRLRRNGRWELEGVSPPDAEFRRVAELSKGPDLGIKVLYGIEFGFPASVRHWPVGTEWRHGDVSYRVEHLRRRDVVPPDGAWAPVWAVMRTLAELHGGDNVRLVVWFG